mmetsp:Transcript_52936/g.163806  ORF Transcript_52936/g.163806 Transcript_52936/m.163806 type:complete len:251 (+) Transcript_52936:479-1231(+)
MRSSRLGNLGRRSLWLRWRRPRAATVLQDHLHHIPCSGVLGDLQGRGTAGAGVVGVRLGLQESLGTDGQVVRGHAMQWRHAIGVECFNVRTPRDEVSRGVLVVAAHATHVQRLRTPRGNVVHEFGILVEQRLQRRLALAQGIVHGRVAAAGIDRPWPLVVVLVLAPDHNLTGGWVTLHNASVNPRPHSVRVWVEAFIVCLPRPPILLHHAGCMRIMRDPDAVCPVELSGHGAFLRPARQRRARQALAWAA